MVKNLALLGIVLVIGFVAFRVFSSLTAEVSFEGFKWNPFHLSTPPPISKNIKTTVGPKLPPSVQSEPEKPKINPPLGFSVNDLSPYYQKVEIDSAKIPRDGGEPGEISIRANHNSSDGIDVSGWKIKGNNGWEIFITKAIADYNPLVLPPESDVILYPQNYLKTYSWANSSFGNRNLRLNKCTGYLNGLYPFNPRLPDNCPKPEEKAIITFSGQCQDFIRSLGNCAIPTANQLNSFSDQKDLACHAYLEKINYRHCYDANRYASDFFSNEWRAWLNQSMKFDRDHDRLLLFDRNGKLVDDYVY